MRLLSEAGAIHKRARTDLSLACQYSDQESCNGILVVITVKLTLAESSAKEKA
jgi:hypothetical protein